MSKDNNLWEENTRLIFGDSSYIFATLIKSIDLTLKYAQGCLGDAFTSAAWALYSSRSPRLGREDLYFLAANKLMSELEGGQFLIRLSMTGENALFIHSLTSMYHGWEQPDPKDKDRAAPLRQVAQRVEAYVLEAGIGNPPWPARQHNGLEYRTVANGLYLSVERGQDSLATARQRVSLKRLSKKAALLEALLGGP